MATKDCHAEGFRPLPRRLAIAGMEQVNCCPSSRLTRARGAELGLAVLTPPAPSLDGRWIDQDGAAHSISEDWATGAVVVEGSQKFSYENDLNEAIADGSGRRAALFDGGYGLRWDDGQDWVRDPTEVLCFTDRAVFTGIVPQLEADLKLERKSAKKRMAAAEAAGDTSAEAFWNNVQNSIKVLMNGLYGGFGAARGGIFPDGQSIAAAITATGRGWICTVKKTIEALAWVAPCGQWGLSAEDRPSKAESVKIVYGDTDSVFAHLPGLSLQQAAAFGEAVSDHFSRNVLPYPQKLEFEKIYQPFVLYKKKMYAGMKFEGDYSEGAKSKLHARGIALVRRDNARLVRTVMKETLDAMLHLDARAADAVGVVARHMALVEASARSMHFPVRPEAHLPIEQFVLSGGISKALDAYAGADNCAAVIARRLMEINPLERVGAGSRVTYVIAKAPSGSRRAEQVRFVIDGS